MDPLGMVLWIIAGVLGVTSMFECAALVYSVRNLTEEKIRIKITNGIKKSLSDENFQKDLIKMMLSKRTTELMSDAIMTRIKAMFDGARGFDEKQKKAFFRAVAEGEEVNPIVQMLPKKAQAMIGSNPELVQLGLQIVQPFIEKYLGGILNGEGEITQGTN